MLYNILVVLFFARVWRIAPGGKMSRAFWTRLRILDRSGKNEAVFVVAPSQKEAEGKTELLCLNRPGEWATPALGPISYGPEDEVDKTKRFQREARKLIDDYLKKAYPKNTG